tara:strand:+ start:1185 stop:2132 length:948 start_codon:yes stop_codon:yes gene_type:complete
MNWSGILPELEGFEAYVQQDLRPQLEALQAERPRAIKSLVLGVALALLVFSALAAFIWLQEQDLRLLLLAAFAAGGIGWLGSRPLLRLHKKAKVRIMDSMCGYLGLNYRLKPQNCSVSRFRKLALVPGHDERKTEDQIYGRIGEVDFNLFEAKLVRISRDSKGRRRRTTVFRGLLAEFDFHKNFSGTTIIRKDQTFLGNILDGLGRGDRVKLEDPVFEKHFEVYASDQVEARYLLTPAFMERILNLGRIVGEGNLQMAFDRGALSLAIRKSKNSFEGGGIFMDFTDPARLVEAARELALIYGIVETLRLELKTRI